MLWSFGYIQSTYKPSIISEYLSTHLGGTVSRAATQVKTTNTIVASSFQARWRGRPAGHLDIWLQAAKAACCHKADENRKKIIFSVRFHTSWIAHQCGEPIDGPVDGPGYLSHQDYMSHLDCLAHLVYTI